ncbi:MAG: hypothetical protein LBK73_09535 [Treponema sp.]|jgi:hypothetical protein|nr:hypothetical protein [Treponema sp.]
MKKFFIALLALALVAGNLFAEIKVGGWGRADFIPLELFTPADGDSKATASTGVNWGANPRFGLSFEGSGDTAGVVITLHTEDGGISGDNTYVWIAPLSFLKFDVGYRYWDVLRGGFGLEGFNGYAGAAATGEDQIFPRFNTADTNSVWNSGKGENDISYHPGAVVEFTPVSGLSIGLALRTQLFNTRYNRPGNPDDLADLYKGVQFGVGYDIENIGLIRVGYFGSKAGVWDRSVALAFKLTAVDILGLDVGFAYRLDGIVDDVDLEGKNSISIGLGADIKPVSLFHIQLNALLKLGGDGDKAKGNEGFVVETYLNPEVSLDFATIGLGFAWGANFAQDDNNHLGFSLYLKKGFGGVTFQGGVGLNMQPSGSKKDSVFYIPLQLTYSF